MIEEIEKEKEKMEVEDVDEGKIGKIIVDEGKEGVKVNKKIEVIIGEGESDEDIGYDKDEKEEEEKEEKKEEEKKEDEVNEDKKDKDVEVE